MSDSLVRTAVRRGLTLAGLLLFSSGAFAFESPAYDKACNEMGRGDYDGAIITFGEAIGFDMNNMKAYIKRGQCFYKLRNYEEAVKDFSHVIEVEPKNSNAYLWRGTANSKTGDHEACVRDYLAAIRLDPQLAAQYKNNGGAAAVAATTDQAKRNGGSNSPIAENQTAVKAYEEAMALYVKQKDTEDLPGGGQTEQAMRKAAQDQRPERQNSHRRGAYAPSTDEDLQANGERASQNKSALRDRIAKLNSAIEADDRNQRLYFRRGLLYEKMGSLDQAIADLTKSIDIDPMTASFYIARARIYHHQGQSDLAQADLAKARSVDPTVPLKIRFSDGDTIQRQDRDFKNPVE